MNRCSNSDESSQRRERIRREKKSEEKESEERIKIKVRKKVEKSRSTFGSRNQNGKNTSAPETFW
jgi:hypothetical protein